MTLDPRLYAVRPDLAAVELRDRVLAPRYAQGAPAVARVGRAAVRRAPSDDAPMDTEILFGEGFTVYERASGWVWGQCVLDRYVGYVRAAALGPEPDGFGPPPDHRVAVPRTFLYPAPDIKHPPLAALPMNAKLAVAEQDARFAALATGGFVIAAHLRPLDDAGGTDYAAVAAMFLGAPYLWGGKTWAGLDCSGLIQTALEAVGMPAPRDTDLQQAALGAPTVPSESRRGDLAFWPGHVGVLLDAETLLHASGHHMQVVREPFAQARARIAAGSPETLQLRRLAH